MQHKLVWRYICRSEFCGCDTTRTECFDSWEAANARVFELMKDHQKEDISSTLTIEWYDGDEINPLYRRFQLDVPDRG